MLTYVKHTTEATPWSSTTLRSWCEDRMPVGCYAVDLEPYLVAILSTQLTNELELHVVAHASRCRPQVFLVWLRNTLFIYEHFLLLKHSANFFKQQCSDYLIYVVSISGGKVELSAKKIELILWQTCSLFNPRPPSTGSVFILTAILHCLPKIAD